MNENLALRKSDFLYIYRADASPTIGLISMP
jgi:hypothetical protein